MIFPAETAREKKSFDWWSLGPAGITALVAVLGWIAVERFARSRERRSDLRALILNFSDQVQAISQEAVRYYGLPGNAPEAVTLSAVLKGQIQLLKEHLDVLCDAGLPVEFTEDLKRFRQAVTGGEFDSLSRQPQPAESQLAYKITASGQALVGTVKIKLFRELARSKPWGEALCFWKRTQR